MACIKRRSLVAAAAVSGVALLSVAPAGAQYYYPAPRIYAPAPPPPPPPSYPAAIGPHQADAIVRSLGLEPVSRALPRGPVYVVHAVGREGSAMQVTIDRYSGRVVQIARLARSAPRIAALPPGYDASEPDNDGPAFEDDDLPPLSGDDRDGYDERSDRGPPPAGPSVITRRGIQTNELPPVQPRYAAPRDPDVTGSVAPGRVDPLVGVPKEFRGPQQRTAARAPEPAPRATPMPRPRPVDAPQIAQTDNGPAPAVKSETKKEDAPVAKPAPQKVPDVQGFE